MSLYAVTNPATGESVKEYVTATGTEIQSAVATADAAFKEWNKSALPDRVKLLARVAELYTERRTELAAIVTREMGKPIFQAQIEVDIDVGFGSARVVRVPAESPLGPRTGT